MLELFEYGRGADRILSFLEAGECSSSVLGVARTISRGAMGLSIWDYGNCISIRQLWPNEVSGEALVPPDMRFVQGSNLSDAVNFLGSFFFANRPLRMAVLGKCLPSTTNLVLAAVRPDLIVSDSGIGRGFVLVPTPEFGSKICVEAACSERARAAEDLLSVAMSAALRYDSIREYLYDLSDIILASGFHPIDRDGQIAWVWSGAAPSARFLLPSITRCGRWMVTLYLYASKSKLDAESILVWVEGRQCNTRFFPDELKIEIDGDWELQGHWLEIELNSSLQTDPVLSRRLGVALFRARFQAR